MQGADDLHTCQSSVAFSYLPSWWHQHNLTIVINILSKVIHIALPCCLCVFFQNGLKSGFESALQTWWHLLSEASTGISRFPNAQHATELKTNTMCSSQHLQQARNLVYRASQPNCSNPYSLENLRNWNLLYHSPDYRRHFLRPYSRMKLRGSCMKTICISFLRTKPLSKQLG